VDLNLLSFCVVVFLLAGYLLLDGFDFGVGALHCFAKGEEERRRMLGTIAPFWDGNEVWLVTAGGVLFAAFPKVYASVFSGFYLGFILFLFALIFRAVSIEFRGKLSAGWWRGIWDAGFCASSILAGFLIGIVFGNLVRGIPLSADGEFTGSFLSLFHPYSVLSGVMAVSFFVMHGALYLVLRTEGELQERARRWAACGTAFFSVVFSLLVFGTVFQVFWISTLVKQQPLILLTPAVVFAVISGIFIEMKKRRDLRAFFLSCFSMLLIAGSFSAAFFPNLVISSLHSGQHLTVYNAASSSKTLSIVLLIALIGSPAVLVYTGYVYWVFRGKVKLDSNHY